MSLQIKNGEFGNGTIFTKSLKMNKMSRCFLTSLFFCTYLSYSIAQFSNIQYRDLASLKESHLFENGIYNNITIFSPISRIDKSEKAFDYWKKNLSLSILANENNDINSYWKQTVRFDYLEYKDSIGVFLVPEILKIYDSLGVSFDVFPDIYSEGEGSETAFTSNQSFKTLAKAEVLLSAKFIEKQDTIIAEKVEYGTYTFFIKHLNTFDNLDKLRLSNLFAISSMDFEDITALKSIYKYPEFHTIKEGIHKYLIQNKQIKMKMNLANWNDYAEETPEFPDQIMLFVPSKIIAKEKKIVVEKINK
jgi:hypothetical protein